MKSIICFALAALCLAITWRGLLAAAVAEDVGLSTGPYLSIKKGRAGGTYTISALPMHQKFFLGTEKLSWYEANFYCKLGYMRLVQLSYPNVAAELKGFLNFYGLQGKYYWTGGSRLDMKNVWSWNMNSYYNFGYTHWAQQQPTNDTTAKDCLKLWGKTSEWFAEDCDLALDFICER